MITNAVSQTICVKNKNKKLNTKKNVRAGQETPFFWVMIYVYDGKLLQRNEITFWKIVHFKKKSTY